MTSPSTPFGDTSDTGTDTETTGKASRLERIRRTLELGLYTEYWDSPETDPDPGNSTNPAA